MEKPFLRRHSFCRDCGPLFTLIRLNRLKNPRGCLARWSLRLQPYTCQLIHRNVVPDLLSRSVPMVSSVDVEFPLNTPFEDTTDKWYKNMVDKVSIDSGE